MVKQTARTSKKKAMFQKVMLVNGPYFYMFVHKCLKDYPAGTVIKTAFSDRTHYVPKPDTFLITVIGDL